MGSCLDTILLCSTRTRSDWGSFLSVVWKLVVGQFTLKLFFRFQGLGYQRRTRLLFAVVSLRADLRRSLERSRNTERVENQNRAGIVRMAGLVSGTASWMDHSRRVGCGRFVCFVLKLLRGVQKKASLSKFQIVSCWNMKSC